MLLIFSLDVRYRLGIGLGLLSAALYSLFSILNINVARKTGEDSATMLLYELAGGVLFLSLLMPFYTEYVPAGSISLTRQDGRGSSCSVPFSPSCLSCSSCMPCVRFRHSP